MSTDLIDYAARVDALARILFDATAKLGDDPQGRVHVAASMIPKAIGDHADALGMRSDVDIYDDRLVFSKVAAAIGFARQDLPKLLATHHRSTFGLDVRAAFDALLGVDASKAPTIPDDDGDTVWALFFDDDGCGPSAVSLTPEVLDHLRMPDEPEPAPDDPLSRTIMIGVALSPDEVMQFVEPGGFALKAPAAERLIIKLREAIDRPRDPRLDAPAAEATPS